MEIYLVRDKETHAAMGIFWAKDPADLLKLQIDMDRCDWDPAWMEYARIDDVVGANGFVWEGETTNRFPTFTGDEDDDEEDDRPLFTLDGMTEGTGDLEDIFLGGTSGLTWHSFPEVEEDA